MDDSPRVRSYVDGRVATLELTGRGGTNAMDLRFVRELDGAVAELEAAVEANAVDVVVLRAAGTHFCVGGDIVDFARAAEPTAHIAQMIGFANRAIRGLHDLPVPIVARWQGAAAGGGIGLLLMADVVVAAADATMTGGYTGVGLTPDAGVSWALPRRIGQGRAREILLTNRRVGADELLALGIATRLVDPDDLDGALSEIVGRLLAVDGATIRETTRLTRIDPGDTLGAHLEDEGTTIARLAGEPPFAAALRRYRPSRAGRSVS